jgi:hypothetical protein
MLWRASAHPITLTGINVAWGMYEGGSTRVLTGTNLGGATSVKFGGVEAASFVVDSPVQITALTPAATTPVVGVVDISVTSPAGTATLAAVFEYVSVGRAAAVAGAASYVELDPRLGYTLASGRVSGWLDQGNSAIKADVAQATAGNQPLWTASGPNGQPCLTFNAARPDIIKKTTTTTVLSSGTGIWFGAVLAPTSGATRRAFDAQQNGGATLDGVAVLWTSTLVGDIYVHDGTSAKDAQGGAAEVTATNIFVQCSIASGPVAKKWINGTTKGTTPAMAAYTLGKNLDKWYIGARNDNLNPFDGTISHIFSIAANGNAASFLVMEKYFEEKYGLTIATI